MKKLVSRKEVALHFGVTCDTVHNWEKKGLVKPFCTINGRPRYDFEEVIKSIAEGKGGIKCN